MNMTTNDVETGEEPVEVVTKDINKDNNNDITTTDEDDTNRRQRNRRTFGIVLLFLIVIGLIVGLSVGLTRPNDNSESSAASLAAQGNANATGSTGTAPNDGTGDTAEASTTRVQFQTTGVTRAFNVTMDLLSPDILEGYDNDDELKADLGQAVRFFINTFIEDQIRWGRYEIMYGGGMEFDDTVASGGDAMGAAGPNGKGESAAGATDFETNNQVDGVDEADMVKSDGTYVYAVYGDTIVVWEAATGTYVTNYTLPAPNATYSYGGGGGGIMYRKLKMAASASGGNGMMMSANASDGNGSDMMMPSNSSDGNGGGGMMGDAMMPWIPTAYISGMSLEGDRLVVYASGYGPEVVAAKNVSSACSYDAFATRVLVFSTTTPLTLIAQKDVHGSFRDARAIGDDIHLVTTCSFDFYPLTETLYLMNDEFVNMTDNQYRQDAAKKAEPLIDAYVELMVKDIYTNGKSKIPKVTLWASQYGNDTTVVEQANAGGAIQAYTSLVSFSVADLNEGGDELQVSSTGACMPSSWGYTYTIDGWMVFAAQGWNWDADLAGTSQSTYLLGFSINGTNASPAFHWIIPWIHFEPILSEHLRRSSSSGNDNQLLVPRTRCQFDQLLDDNHNKFFDCIGRHWRF